MDKDKPIKIRESDIKIVSHNAKKKVSIKVSDSVSEKQGDEEVEIGGTGGTTVN